MHSYVWADSGRRWPNELLHHRNFHCVYVSFWITELLTMIFTCRFPGSVSRMLRLCLYAKIKTVFPCCFVCVCVCFLNQHIFFSSCIRCFVLYAFILCLDVRTLCVVMHSWSSKHGVITIDLQQENCLPYLQMHTRQMRHCNMSQRKNVLCMRFLTQAPKPVFSILTFDFRISGFSCRIFFIFTRLVCLYV